METVKIRIVGDMMLGGCVRNKIEEFGPSYPFKRIIEKIDNADIFLANLECTLFESSDPPLPNKILLQSTPLSLHGLKDAGINIVSLANNHAFDYGLEPYNKGRRFLEDNGIACIGGGDNIAQASKLTLVKVKDLLFGFLAYCDMEAGCYQIATPSSYGVAPIDVENILQDLEEAKKKADFVIVYLHWGREFIDYPSPKNINIARTIIENGATIVAGAHAHVFHGYEKYLNGLIIYDLGSFIFGDIIIEEQIKYKYRLVDKKSKEGIMVNCEFNRNGLINFEFIPCQINSDFQVNIPHNIERKKIIKRFQKQSSRITHPLYKIFYIIYLIKIKLYRKYVRIRKIFACI